MAAQGQRDARDQPGAHGGRAAAHAGGEQNSQPGQGETDIHHANCYPSRAAQQHGGQHQAAQQIVNAHAGTAFLCQRGGVTKGRGAQHAYDQRHRAQNHILLCAGGEDHHQAPQRQCAGSPSGGNPYRPRRAKAQQHQQRAARILHRIDRYAPKQAQPQAQQ